MCNKGQHGFTTMLYEFILSSVAGNGANFGGPGNNIGFRNLTTSFAMLSGCFVLLQGDNEKGG
ncbi:potassium-transporting ATPase subunit KdpA [Mucilaginibacter sp. OK268]|uniref:potassium-transporting ATPase subunit KdpA n=1 Tax=Mucilaginibacter sp. OK268 TaxID=1881048 RepID=UPI002100F19F|nr:potassium-transporting ATPase subunit KdpA [Mucilaginibacter sp. OK268]